MDLALSVGSDSSRKRGGDEEEEKEGSRCCDSVQLDLKLSWSTNPIIDRGGGGLDVNERPLPYLNVDAGPSSSDSRPVDVRKRDVERASSRCSDEEEGGFSTRKKLRLSKEQSCYLEESFKEHTTLNPKQKQALAKQLNLRPRQVEVWFQNRRARTKLKQTEVDCEYLKRCCESLTEENRRLHKELQDLKALKSPHNNPFPLQGPATTLTMCPSCCERVSKDINTSSNRGTFDVGVPKSRFCPFSSQRSTSTASS